MKRRETLLTIHELRPEMCMSRQWYEGASGAFSYVDASVRVGVRHIVIGAYDNHLGVT
jgi:hypothetical protein